jgi:hypothetical protein
MERFVSRLVLGSIAPVILFLAGWWGTLLVFGDSRLIPWMALAGLTSGLLLDATMLRGRLDSLHQLSTGAQVAVALFYALMIYGFFMGLPVPLLIVGVGWGFAASRHRGTARERSERIRVAATGSALLMLIACLATAWLAFHEPSIQSQVRGMLGLNFTPSIAQLAVGSALGAVLLTGMAYAIPVIMRGRLDRRALTF